MSWLLISSNLNHNNYTWTCLHEMGWVYRLYHRLANPLFCLTVYSIKLCACVNDDKSGVFMVALMPSSMGRTAVNSWLNPRVHVNEDAGNT
jgi:hypothetical protein